MDVGRAMEKTIIKIIDLDHKKKNISSINWVNNLQAEGIHVSFLSNPCQLTKTIGEVPDISEIEIRHLFTPKMWTKVQGNEAAGAICISHLRALHECLSEKPEANTFIIIEGDVTEHQNTHQLMSAFLAVWHGNKHLENTRYAALTFSDWHSGYSQTVRGNSQTVPDSVIAPYFKMVNLPMQKNQYGDWRYQFVGQGARAIAYDRTFLQQVLDLKVSSYWDMHLLEILTKQSNEEWQKNPKNHQPFKATVCDPPIFEHVPKFEERFRGSERLKAGAVNQAEETSYYITLALTHEWGLINRLQTMALVGAIAGLYRVGLYVCWEPKKACNSTFAETNCLDMSSEVFLSIPFIKIYNDPKGSDWRAAVNNQHWHLAHFESQCQVDMGLEFLWENLATLAERTGEYYMLKTLLPSLREKITEDYCWQLINITDAVYKKAFDYVEASRSGGLKQVAIHCRRGDHKYMNCDVHKEKQAPDAFDIEVQWENGDNMMQDFSFNKEGQSSTQKRSSMF